MALRRVFIISLGLLLGMTRVVAAESPAPSAHWGAIDYPDQVRTLDFGLTLNRFTEFDPNGQRYNQIRETMGFKMVTLSWTERPTRFPEWGTNLTLGVGPTDDQPT